MAFEDDLRNFLENRLLAWDPTIDVSSNSPVQVKVIDPTIERFGEDPFSVDIPTFMRDRLVQEYPELAADDAGLLEDLFTEPMQLLLEPFKRQIELIRINQSAANADLLSDDEADALGANFFQDREEGEYASGQVRLYYSAPTTSRITTDKQLTSSRGLAFFPTENSYITSAQMIFNRDGNQYFLDISVRAAEAGTSYNVGKGEINTIDDVEGVVRVANLTDFTTGLAREDNETYLGNIPQALTERSLVTKRGVITRVPDTFGNEVSAIQVVGAGEDGMDRDILTGTGEGFLHIIGNCAFFGSMIIIDSIIFKDEGPEGNVVVQVGDTIRLMLDYSVDPDRNIYEGTITDFTSSGVGTADEKYIIFIDQTFTTVAPGVTYGDAAKVAILKAGYITISGLPGGMSVSTTVPDGEVHLGGHTDVFIRPSADEESEGVIPNLTTDDPLLALLDVEVWADDNKVGSSTNFVTAQVLIGDTLVIESGSAAGSYRILAVGDPAATNLRVDTVFDSDETSLRARVVRNIRVDLVEPKVPKVPFNTSSVSDLSTAVGSTLFRLDTVDIQALGAVVGDTIRVLDGLNAGDYIISSFDPVLGGQGPIVDSAAQATETGLRYEVFTASDGLEFPLVRIKALEVLDSTEQGTGITVPYGDAVDIRPRWGFEGAGDSVRVLNNDMAITPNIASLWSALTPTTVTPGAGKDARYSLEIEYADGTVRKTTSAAGGSPITEAEVNFPPFLWNGRNDTIIALTTRDDPDFDIPTAGDHRTSDVAKAQIGDSIVILDGPNQGSYIIKDLRVLDMWADATVGHAEIALVQIDQELSVDVIGDFINYVNTITGAGTIDETDLAVFIEKAADKFYDASEGFIESILVPAVQTAFTSQGLSFTNAEILQMILNLGTTGYEIGGSAKGTVRAYFLDPVSVELNFGEEPTYFRSLEDPSLVYRLASGEDAQVFPESLEHTEPTEWYRDMVLKYITVPGDKIFAYLNSGSSFVQRGIQEDDIIQYHPAINDYLARGDMTSGWMCITYAGSNQIRLMVGRVRTSSGWSTENLKLPEPGHLLFIDSGPDVGAYTITSVSTTNDFTSDPPGDSAGDGLLVQVDRSLTHSTDTYPSANDRDFKSYVRAILGTSGNSASFADQNTRALTVGFANAGGSVTDYSHTFGVGVTTAALAAADILGASGGLELSEKFHAFADGDELVLQTKGTNNPREYAIVRDCSALQVNGGALYFDVGQDNGDYLGAVAAAGTKKIYGTLLASAAVNDWISVYAASSPTILTDEDDEAYLGTYQVVVVDTETSGIRTGLDYVELDRSANFPAEAEVRWVIHTAPDTTPADTTGGGKELSSNYVRFRMYEEVAEERTISIPWTSTPSPIESDSVEQIEVDADFITSDSYSHRMPYRILREYVKKISSTFMATQRSGALYYVDLPLLGLGVRAELNITEDTSLELYSNYTIAGYTLEVEKPIFSFSTEEQTSIILPRSVLPVGSTPDVDNELTLAGQSLQVNYDRAPLVDSIQQFMNSPLDRVIVANVLVRHFLPSYVILDVSYVGGDSEEVVAQQIINHINSIDPDVNELVADDIAEIIRKRNATQVRLPITLIALTHGTDRKIRGIQSKDVIGGENLPTFSGNFNQTYFIPGPDTSAEDPRPSGEQIFLIRI